MTWTSEQDLMMQGRAATAEKSNRPTGLIVLASFALIVAFAYAAWTVSGAMAAKREAERSVALVSQMEPLVDRLIELRQQEDEIDLEGRFPKETRLLTKLIESAREAGFEEDPSPQPGTVRTQLDYPLVRQQAVVNLTNEPLDKILRWIELASDRVTGLHLIGLRLEPSSAGWTSQIRFARWEIDE